MRILIIEDDADLADTLAAQLKPTYVVDNALTGSQGLFLAKSNEYDLITIDVGLPDISGLEVCKKLRELKVNCPILMLTGISETQTKVESLDSGADDFLVKPFHLVELLARVRALLRRATPHECQNILTARDLEIDVLSRKVTRNGHDILLRRREFDILELLMRNQGRFLERGTILEHVCSTGSASYTNTVDVHMKRLRDKIDRPFEYKLIRTSHGTGYGLIP